jgi:hypothetical protein
MKPFKSVEENRKNYHRWPDRNSVHRASAIFPIFDREHYANNITFLNHWLVKRGIPEIAARHTIRDAGGTRLGQVFSTIDRSKCYSVDLEEILAAAEIGNDLATGSWEVEFFSARNLFIPYPAVVQTIHNDTFFNQVHAYARVLNDFEEHRAVNKHKTMEASVDVVIDDDTDTFVTLINGPVETKGQEVHFHLTDTEGHTVSRSVDYDAPPFETRTLYLSDVFGAEGHGTDRNRTLTVEQPSIDLFYNRLFAGLVQREGGRAVSANHSYYDTSGFGEYFDVDPKFDRQANITMPLSEDLPLVLRLYPITSPADLTFHIDYFDETGTVIATRENVARRGIGDKSDIIEFDVSGLSPGPQATSADLYATTPSGDRVPTRITLQVCYGRPGAMSTSINLSLNTPYVFVPDYKVGLNWMAVSGVSEVENRIAFCHSSPMRDTEARAVKLTLYRDGDEETLTASVTLRGPAGHAAELSALMPNYKEFLGGRNGFIYVESKSPFLRSLTLQTNSRTGHSSGEHSF